MTFWDFLEAHGTKLLGGIGTAIGVLTASTGVIPDKAMPYVLVANGVLTAWRGFENSSIINHRDITPEVK
jgi:hypothetical protein